MAKIIELEEKGSTFKEKISILLQKYRLILLGIFCIAVVILITMAIVFSLRERRLDKGILRMETLLEIYETEWIAEEDDEAKIAAEEKINAEIDFLLGEYQNSFPAQKALFIRGDMAYRQEKWSEAVSAFSTLAEEYPESYLAPVSLTYAATAAEEGEDIEGALKTLRRIIADYPENQEEIYRGMFSIGRIEEGRGNKEEALASYNQLLDSGASNAWTSLAQSRVILLEAQ